MHQELWYRLAFIFILVAMFLVSGYFRSKARAKGGIIERRMEDTRTIVGRILVALPLYASLLAYAIHPEWMAWASIAIPAAVRLAAVVMGVALLPALWWVFRSIGPNISETHLTKPSHTLVTHGPYRWVRHPLYLVAGCMLVILSMLAANLFMLSMTIVAVSAITLYVVPKEEAALVEKFGDAYRDYQQDSGRLLPRLGKCRGQRQT